MAWRVYQSFAVRIPGIEAGRAMWKIWALFLKGSVAVVPIRIGSGMRMKILDAVLSKVPFVTTAKGVEGIDFKDGEDCLIVDDPAGFAEAVIALSSNPQLQRQLVTHAEDSLRQVYNPGQMQERRLAVYEQILGDKVG